MTERIGQTVGPYRLVEKLGAGGMAEVYKAYHPRLERYVAIKFIRPELATDEDFKARFEQEARAVAQLSHPNIVHIYDFGEEGARYYLVMEFVAGSTLKDRLQSLANAGEMMPPDETLHIIRQVSRALDDAHRQGIIHRDVKPANIMLTPDGRAVLNDFGLARMIGATAGLTRTGATIGTPAYMSPEQIRGERAEIGPASDLYSLGVVLYEMLTGCVPFSADTPLAVMLKHLNDPIPLPRARNPLLSEDVERVILKALAKDPTDRYQTAGDLAQALQQSLSAAPAAVSPPRPARWTQKPGIWLGALAVLLILAGGIVGALVAGRIGGGALAPTAQPLTPVPTAFPATPLPTVAPLPTRPSTPQPSQTAEPGGMISILQHLPAPGYLAEGITWDGTDLWISDNSGTIFQVDPAGRTLNALPAPEVTPMGLAWDGSSLWLFTTNYGFIYQFQFEGPEARTIQSFQSPARVFGGGISHDMAWDGESLWYANQFNVYRLDPAGNILSSFAFPRNVTGLDWDGTHLWLADGEYPATISIVDREGDMLASFLSPIYGVTALAWGDGCLWALGRESLAGDVMIYQLDVSRATDAVAPPSDTSWQAQVLSVQAVPALRAYESTPTGLQPPLVAEEGKTFLVIELGLLNQTQGAILRIQDITVIDDQGQNYTPTGFQWMPDRGFAVGQFTGIVHLIHRDPPSLLVEFKIERQMETGSQTVQGEVPIAASSGEWPTLSLALLISEDGGRLRLRVPGAGEIDLGEPTGDIQGQIGDSLLPGNLA